MSNVVYRGPAQVEFASTKFHSQGEITVTHVPETFDVMADAWGTVDTRLKSRVLTVSFTPTGIMDGEAMAFIIAASARLPGTTVMGGPLVIRPFVLGQEIITLDRAGVTGIPGLRLGASKTLYGAITFTGLETVGENTGVIATPSSYSAPTIDWNPLDILTEPWKGSYLPVINPSGGTELVSSFTDLETEDGWEINAELTTEPARTDACGIVDYTQKDFKITATCKPVGITATQLLALVQRSGSGRNLLPGDSITGKVSGAHENHQLILTSRSGHVLKINNCGIRSGALAYGSTANRTPSLMFTAIRDFSTIMEPMLVWTPLES